MSFLNARKEAPQKSLSQSPSLNIQYIELTPYRHLKWPSCELEAPQIQADQISRWLGRSEGEGAEACVVCTLRVRAKRERLR